MTKETDIRSTTDGTAGRSTSLHAGRPVELELKFRPLDESTAERYLALESLAGFVPASTTRITRVQDRYMDTVDGTLAQAGLAARLRSSEGRRVITLKSTRNSASRPGLHRREEVEGPADGGSSPADWPASDARSIVLELCGDAPLVERATIRQVRRKRELRHGGTLVELSLDEVEVVSGERVLDRFTELEVELVRGDPGRLATMGKVMAADPGLAPSEHSKLDTALAAVGRGIPLAPHEDEADGGGPREGRSIAEPVAEEVARENTDSEEPLVEEPLVKDHTVEEMVAKETAVPKPAPGGGTRPVQAHTPTAADAPVLETTRTPGVAANDHVAEAGRKVLRFHLARMIAREPGTRDGSNPEELKSMRVATRRMRAAWRVFGYGFQAEKTRRYRSRLRVVAGSLGAVRDLDVLLDGAEAYRANLAALERDALESLFQAWRDQRDAARIQLLRELDSAGYARFVRAYVRFVQAEGAAVLPAGPAEPQLIRDTAPSRIWAAHERVRAYEAILRHADVPTLHEMRIAGKWLRYTIEFVREPLGPEVEPLIARIAVLQDHLGLMNDADVAAIRIRDFLRDRSARLSGPELAAIGRYLGSREAEVARLKQSVGAPWRGVAGLSFRRKLGRVVAGL